MVALSTESPASASSGASRYYVLKPLAAGGMATVELALQVSPGGFERLVVLKRVKPHLLSSEEIVMMFREESRIAARLNHPHLIHAYEAGQDESGAFLAMEYLSGQSYAQLIERVGLDELELPVVLEVLIATLEGLDYVHGLREMSGRHMALVHRDISPSNLFITYTGQVKVLDFGIAKAKLSAVQTQVGVLKGKVSYMSPEQALGGELDARADLYSVGVMLWEALAGRRRWGEAPEAVVVSQLISGKPAASPGAVERGLPALAEEICLKAMAFDAADRFQTAGELRAALEGLAAALGPRLSARGIAEYVVDFFAVERAQAENQVERCLAELDRGEASEHTDVDSDPNDTRSFREPREAFATVPLMQPTQPITTMAAEPSRSVAPARAKRSWLFALPVAAAVAGVGWAGLHGASHQPADAPSATANASEAPALTVAPSSEPSPALVAAAAPSAAADASASAHAHASAPPSAHQAGHAPVVSSHHATPAHVALPKKPAAKSSTLDLDRGSPW